MHRRKGKAKRFACAVALGASMLVAHAQGGSNGAVRTLLDNAHAAEMRNRMDLASQAWRQVLLNDPNNTEALGGLARAAKLRGDDATAQQYLNKLRAINPNDPGINRAESVQANSQQIQRLNEAGKLAQAGQYAQAMEIYRKEFPNGPTSAEWALAYYETEAATEGGRPHAVQGLRGLVAKYPKDSRYQITLGRILTYDPRTREEGRRLLMAHPSDPAAMEAVRQTFGWDAQNPDIIPDLRLYLKNHKDPALTATLKTLESQQARGRRGGGRVSGGGGTGTAAAPYVEPAELGARRENDAEVAAAYASLNAKHLEEAEARFKTLLAKNPNDNRALAGMGYVRMNQSNFGGAISFLEQAKQEGSRDAGVDKGLATSRFWYTMGEGGIALNENDLATAEKNYRQALAMRPGSPEALEGLAGTLMKAQQPAAAIPVYEQYVRLKPTSTIAWRGLFSARFQAGDAAGALAVEKRIPASVRAQLNRDPDFLRTLASAYSAVGRDADAQRVLRSALELPFPQGGLKTETRLQYAALLQQANRLDQAAGLFREVLAEDTANVPAWQGLVRVEHAMKNDALAQQTIETMPPSVYDQAMRDPGFMSTAASVYEAQNKPDVAQGLLEKAVAAQTTAGQKPPAGTLLQLAGLYVQRGNAQAGYNIYRQVLQEDSSRTDAWKGLINALHASGHDKEALAQIQQIPAEPRRHLEQDVEYLQTVGGIYNGLGQPREAMIFLNRVQQKYAASHSMPPADIDIQNAWLLFNGDNDTGLYRQLMFLGSRTDLTDEQRRTVQTIWANWSVRRANQLLAQGYAKRPIAILNAAARAFPDNPGVFKALASGYARAGLAKQAVDIFKAQNLQTATASDYKAAVGAALAANDTKDAETWLRFALDQYPNDAQILTLAAKFEQARGDNGRAADYYRASLAAMPPPDPGAELADELSRPVQSYRPPTVAQQQDLAALLMPGADPAQQAAIEMPAERPYLPSYGSQYGQAPVVLTPDGQPAGAAIVPSYMTNPAYQQQRIQRSVQRESLPQQRTPNNVRRLGDYVPQASVSPADMQPGLDGRPANDASAEAAIRSFQMEQVRRATATAQAQGTGLPDYSGVPDGTVTASNAGSSLTPGAVIASNQAPPGEIYGPFVPYRPEAPSKDMAVMPLYSGVVQHVKIPAAMDPAPEGDQIANAETVEQQMKYLPNSRIQKGTSVPPEIAAFDAAEVRRHQSDLNPGTISAVPTMTGPMSGQSNPPTEADIPVQQTQYVAPTGQTTRPSTLPAMPTTDGVNNSTVQTNQNQYGGLGYGSYSNGRSSELPYAPSATDRQMTIGQQYPQPRGTRAAQPTTVRRVTRRTAAAPSTAPGPAYAPLYYPAVPSALTAQGYPGPGAPVPLGVPPSDAQLVARNLPPLRGGYYPMVKEAGPPLTERQEAELALSTIEASYSGWLGGTASVRFRTGTAGINRLYDFEAPFEASFVAGKSVRFSIIPKAIFLNSGQLQLDPTADPASGNSYIGSLGLFAANAPSAQYASGVGGEIQMVTQNFGLAVGYTPYEFLVRNITGRFRWRPGGGPFSIFAERDSVRDTQLSYAGMRDPGSVTPVFGGNIWGGVVSTGGGVRLDFGDEKAGFYASAAGYALTGYHVLENRRYEGTAGAYFRVRQFPGVGSLNIGGTFFGMHYDHNERGLTFGNGGYFSPEAYFLAAVPVTFTGSAGGRWHYVVSGAAGIQTFQEASAEFYPLDRAMQQGVLTGANCTLPQIAARTCGYFPVNSNTGLNFDINGQASYRFDDHWFLGGFFKANNTNNYGTATIGFSVRYMFRKQYATEDYPTGLFPTEGFRPLRVP